MEDERQMAEAVAQVLRKNHYTVQLAYDGEEGLDEGLTGTYDILVLDIMLPGLDGIELVRRLRAGGIGAPVLLLTARGDTGSKVQGLDAGADDYLPKPFQAEELLARLRALGRRRGALCPGGLLSFAGVELDPHNLLLRGTEAADGREIPLTLKESQLLELLIEHKGRILSKDAIIQKLWGYDSNAEGNHVEVYISFLRKKLRHLGGGAAIRTVRGAGYLLGAANGREEGHV